MNLAIGLTEIATTLVVGKYITNLYRKQTLAIVYGIAPICTTLFMFQIVSSSPLLSTILILIIRVMTSNLLAYHSEWIFYDCHDSNLILSVRNSIYRSWVYLRVLSAWIIRSSSFKCVFYQSRSL